MTDRRHVRRVTARHLDKLAFCGLAAIAQPILSGCGGSDTGAEPATGTSQEALLGGSGTNARPEIGRLDVASVQTSLCAGTLVDPSYIVTAARCFDFTSGPRNDLLTLTSTTGVSNRFVVDRAYAYGTGPGPGDIAFAHVSVQVPTSVASMTFFGAEPTPSESVSVFDYGCSNRTTGAGGGFKNFVDFSFGSTAIDCESDIGGPRLHGPHTGTGWIWGIDDAFTTPSQIDAVADVTRIGPQLLNAMRKVGGTTVTNTPLINIPQLSALPGVKAVAGDFNGDGKGDIALVGGSGWTTIPIGFGDGLGGFTITNAPVAGFPGLATAAGVAVAGDFDGDGRTDIALLDGPLGWATIPIAFSNGDGTFRTTNAPTANIPQWSQVAGAKAVVGDFDRDGLADIALVGGTGWTTIPIGYSNGSVGSFTDTDAVVANLPALAQVSGAVPLVGDFNGDGFADLALSGGTGWTTIPVGTSNRTRGSGFIVTNFPSDDFPTWAQVPGVKLLAGDFDGDGAADIAAVGGTGWTTSAFAISNRTGSFATANLPMATFPAWANAAPTALSVHIDTGPTSDIVLLGVSGWTSVPVAHLSK